jgi:hypothetical protein
MDRRERLWRMSSLNAHGPTPGYGARAVAAAPAADRTSWAHRCRCEISHLPAPPMMSPMRNRDIAARLDALGAAPAEIIAALLPVQAERVAEVILGRVELPAVGDLPEVADAAMAGELVRLFGVGHSQRRPRQLRVVTGTEAGQR